MIFAILMISIINFVFLGVVLLGIFNIDNNAENGFHNTQTLLNRREEEARAIYELRDQIGNYRAALLKKRNTGTTNRGNNRNGNTPINVGNRGS